MYVRETLNLQIARGFESLITMQRKVNIRNVETEQMKSGPRMAARLFRDSYIGATLDAVGLVLTGVDRVVSHGRNSDLYDTFALTKSKGDRMWDEIRRKKLER